MKPIETLQQLIRLGQMSKDNRVIFVPLNTERSCNESSPFGVHITGTDLRELAQLLPDAKHETVSN